MPRPRGLRRPPWMLLACLTALLMTLGACTAPPQGSAPSPTSPPGSTPRSAPGSTPGSTPGSGAYPLTLQQVGGPIELPNQPQRVFMIDNWGLDMAVAMGVKPAGVATYFPPSAWLENAEEMVGVEVTTVTDSFPVEKIAAARPDLIVDFSGYTVDDPGAQKQLEAVAPILYPPSDVVTDPWQDRLRHLGDALGRSADAERAVAEGEKVINDAKREYPDLAGASLTLARFDPPASFGVVADDEDVSRRFLNDELGFTTPPKQAEAYRKKQFRATAGVLEGVSLERLDVLDGDADAVLIWFQEDKNLEDLNRQQVWRQVPFVAEDRLVPLDINGAIAFRSPSPLAAAWAVENLMPQVQQAVENARG